MSVVDTALHEALVAAVGGLLVDKDVASVDVVEGGLPEVVRRGRRERLHVLVEGPLFQLLRERGATTQVVSLRLSLPSGVVVVFAAPLRDGRIAVSLRRTAPTDVQLTHLVEEGVLPAGVDGELVAAVWQGTGVVVLGPARAARNRVAVGLARAVGTSLRVIALGDDVPAGAWPAPLVDDVVERARIACALGADALFAIDVDAGSAAALATAALPVPLILGVAVSAMEPLLFALGDGERGQQRALCGLAAVIAWDHDGRPRLVELHGDSDGPAGTVDTVNVAVQTAPAPIATTTPVAFAAPTSPTQSMRAPSVAPLTMPSLTSTPLATSVRADDGAVPADWASANIDDDPGWELGNLGQAALSTPPTPTTTPTSSSPKPGSFDAALKAAASRPQFSPRPPPMHPQASALRGTGGLTLEPPGGAVDDGVQHEPGIDEETR
ncbi:MAG TPA: hypothetical protein VGF99_16420 [Myxococcota bacterium]